MPIPWYLGLFYLFLVIVFLCTKQAHNNINWPCILRVICKNYAQIMTKDSRSYAKCPIPNGIFQVNTPRESKPQTVKHKGRTFTHSPNWTKRGSLVVIFFIFVTNLLLWNLYQTAPLMHKLVFVYNGIKWVLKEKTSQISFYLFYLRQKLEKICQKISRWSPFPTWPFATRHILLIVSVR